MGEYDSTSRRSTSQHLPPEHDLGAHCVPGRGTLFSAVQQRTMDARAGATAVPGRVQRVATAATTEDPAQVHAAAARGIATGGSTLPFFDIIQRAFGRHDISGIKAHTGDEAAASARQMGATAYATGDHVVLGDGVDLHTVAHEAAHIVQQRGGVQLKGGVGEVGDPYERHADAVAERVVRGESAEELLGQHTAEGARNRPSHAPIQRTIDSAAEALHAEGTTVVKKGRLKGKFAKEHSITVKDLKDIQEKLNDLRDQAGPSPVTTRGPTDKDLAAAVTSTDDKGKQIGPFDQGPINGHKAGAKAPIFADQKGEWGISRDVDGHAGPGTWKLLRSGQGGWMRVDTLHPDGRRMGRG